MNQAFEKVKETERIADEIISKAKNEIAIKKDKTKTEIAKINKNFATKLQEAKTLIDNETDNELAKNINALNYDWELEKAEIQSKFEYNNENIIDMIVKKVLNINGNS